jgi:hypothetical protein
MEDAVIFIVWLFAEVILLNLAYYSGWIFLKAVSVGKILIQPKRDKWNLRKEKDDCYHLSDMQTALVGFCLWVGIIGSIITLKQ